jgi:hypothetical protein
MSAQFSTYEYHGVNLNSRTLFTAETAFRKSDTADAYSNHPIAVPDTHGLPLQINRSCETVVKLVCTQAPDVSCTNFKVWKDYVAADDDQGVIFYFGSTDSVFTPTSNDSSYADSICNNEYGNNLGNARDWDMQTSITAAFHSTHFGVWQMDVTATGQEGSYNRTAHYVYDEA